MGKNEIISLRCFDQEIGRIGFNSDQKYSSFQYNPAFLKQEKWLNLLPNTEIVKRNNQVQLFKKFDNDTFKGLPPFVADSLPDMFGNFVFQRWLESKSMDQHQISPLEQLTYVSNRGMGALEYLPAKEIPKSAEINLSETIRILSKVIDQKRSLKELKLGSEELLNIFKIGSSAGGARPKILIAEHIKDKTIIPGDITHSEDYNHYLVKLDTEEKYSYQSELIEYTYYQMAREVGISMMDSHLIDNKHFATKRFDRINGKKVHTLTACGLTGWDYKSTDFSSYENLFEIALALKIPYREVEELYKRMVFNVLMGNTDDHLKNHSFVYNPNSDSWNLSPAYDLTYASNPLLNVTIKQRALSINGKRTNILKSDLIKIGEEMTIKNTNGIIASIQSAKKNWNNYAAQTGLNSMIQEKVWQSLITTYAID